MLLGLIAPESPGKNREFRSSGDRIFGNSKISFESILCGRYSMGQFYHVAVSGDDRSMGTADTPFRTISQAAAIALPGDTVIVHEGTYREWVKPQNGGANEIERIIYEAAPGENPVIKGSMEITSWEKVGDRVWKTTVPNLIFGDYNPYTEVLGGDWYLFPVEYDVHAGDVYLNGKSLFEAESLEALKDPQKRYHGYVPVWSKFVEKIKDPDFTIYQWFAEVGDDETVIYANFQDVDPNQELTEINVRKCCFYPEKTGMNYITVRGFEMAQAACPWTPPTADQPGLIGPHWSKGWIIENNVIHDAKCSAISIGKEMSTGHNMCTRYHHKPGYRYQMEAVFRALQIGWSKETIGSHIIRNNTIYDCGQNGIVGHMGCVFSKIYNNHIYNIAVKHEFFGYEIGGIKLHAAIDVEICNNRIHDCTLGTWLDWQAQGARISKNLFYRNDRDFMIEVTHGPFLIDNNVFASPYSIDNVAQGGAYVNNLFCGIMRKIKTLDRATPYHFPHSTDVSGFAVVYSGDDRIYNNIYVGAEPIPAGYPEVFYGTAGYDACTDSYEEYQEKILALGIGDHDIFMKVEQPAYVNGNVYFKGAASFRTEKSAYIKDSFDPQVRVEEEGNQVFLSIELPSDITMPQTQIVTTERLGKVRMVDAIFDDPRGRPIRIDQDLTGKLRAETPTAGPVEGLKPGPNRVRVW